MNIIWTNWKVALGRYWYTGLFFIVLFFVLTVMREHPVGRIESETTVRGLFDYSWHFPLMMVLPFSGILSAPVVHRREVTAKPFAFCLPRYRESLRGLIFSATVPWGIELVLFQLPKVWGEWYHPSTIRPGVFDVYLCVGAAFLMGMAVSLAVHGARLVFSKLQWGLLALASFPLAILGGVVWLSVEVHDTVFWVAAGLVSIVAIVFFWVRLGNMRYVARGHRAIIEEAMDKRAQADVKRTAPAWMDGLFLDWARRYPTLGVRRYVWASLYRTFGLVLSYWKWVLAGALGVSVVLGLTPRRIAEIAFITLGCAAAFMDLPATSNLLLPGGRRERYRGTVIAALAMSLLLLALALGMAGVSELVAIGMGAEAGDLGFRFRAAWLVCVFVPWTGVWQLRGYARPGIENRASALMVAFLSLMVFSLASRIPEWSAQMRLLLFASACFCGWVVFLLALRRVCRRGSLIEQRVCPGE